MVFGYARVSTSAQRTDRQQDILLLAGCERLFIDTVSGLTYERVELEKLMQQLRAGDIVIVTELSRLGRSLSDLIKLIEIFSVKGVEFVSLKEKGIDTRTPEGKLLFNLIGAVMQFEVEIKRQHINEGLISARARGKVGGRPPLLEEKIKRVLKLYKTKKFSISEIEKLTHVSRGTIYKYLKEDKSASL